MHRLTVCPAAAAVVLSAGCGTHLGYGPVVDAPRAPDAVVHARWPGCRDVGLFDRRATGGPPASGSLPSGFTPTTVIWCTSSDRLPGPARAPERGLERRSGDVRPVLDYLALPSLAFGPGAQGACPAMGIAPTWLFLLDRHGRWIAPRLPTDECGYPQSLPGNKPAPWTTLSYTDRVVCTYRQTADGAVCR